MDYNELTAKFKSQVTLFERLLEEALYAVQAALDQANIKYHSLPSRIKNLESFLEKVKRRERRKSHETDGSEWDPFTEIQDENGNESFRPTS